MIAGSTPVLVHNSNCPPVNWDMQEKHFLGHNAYSAGKSQLTADPRILVQRAGTGRQIGPVTRGENGFKEMIDYGENIGFWVSDDGLTVLPTTRAILHYGKKGVHVVPIKPVTMP